jgi:hypothetical protein
VFIDWLENEIPVIVQNSREQHFGKELVKYNEEEPNDKIQMTNDEIRKWLASQPVSS